MMRNQEGFTAVELLVTLFIGTIFLLAGYQLYSIVINDSAATRNRAKASNVALDNARTLSLQFSGSCAGGATNYTTSTTPAVTIPANSGLPNASISGTKDCPIPSGPSRITVTITYGNNSPQDQVSHVLYKY